MYQKMSWILSLIFNILVGVDIGFGKNVEAQRV